MLSPDQVVETYFLEARHQLLEVAALLDRLDAAVAREDRPPGVQAAGKVAVLRQAITALGVEGSPTDRTVKLLELFASV
ncbi:MAG: hypothetical protein ACKO4Z_13140 [Planctomycetota bacterium]|nr:hypothetical protein [Planctomycetota bacterium]